MYVETGLPTPTPEDLGAMVYGDQVTAQEVLKTEEARSVALPTSAFEVLVEEPTNKVEDIALVSRGTKYTMPEGDTNE